jgi:hypothetical protein
MSNCRTFNRSGRKEQQPKQQNPGIIRVNQLAHDLIVANSEKFVKHFAHLFFEENKVTAGITIIKFGSGAVLQVSEEEGQARRPNLISKWVIECEQQDKDKKQNEAEAAQEAATRELGQIHEPEVAVETPVAASAPQPQPAAAHSSISNTHVNEIGLPLISQSQPTDVPGSRSCRSTQWPSAPDNDRIKPYSTSQAHPSTPDHMHLAK